MPAAFAEVAERVSKSTIDSFISRMRELQPSFVPKHPGRLVCITSEERSLVFLVSLAERKWDLSAQNGFREPWESSFYIWKAERYEAVLQEAVSFSHMVEQIRATPQGDRQDNLRQYSRYILGLYARTGDENDTIPEEVMLLATRTDGSAERGCVSYARDFLGGYK